MLQGTLDRTLFCRSFSIACVVISILKDKSMTAILRIRTLAAFANAFRVHPLNHSGRIARRSNVKTEFPRCYHSPELCASESIDIA